MKPRVFIATPGALALVLLLADYTPALAQLTDPFDHLHVPNPEQTLQWYVHAFGGDRTKYKGQVEAVRYRDLGGFFLFAVHDAGARR